MYRPGRKWNVPASGGTHRSRPTVHVGSPSMFVGRGIPDAPPPHPIRAVKDAGPYDLDVRWCIPAAGGKPPPYRVERIGPQKMERACQRRDT